MLDLSFFGWIIIFTVIFLEFMTVFENFVDKRWEDEGMNCEGVGRGEVFELMIGLTKKGTNTETQ